MYVDDVGQRGFIPTTGVVGLFPLGSCMLEKDKERRNGLSVPEQQTCD
jgi:hypothetical protein